MRIHFISGLPRSGSTLLEAILRQNPRFHAAISSPLADMFAGLVRNMSGFHDTAIFISDDQRRRILRSLCEAFYADRSDKEIVFDTSRAWCGLLPAIADLFPDSRMICCVRSPAWILNSIESNVQRNSLNTQRIFNFETRGNVYTRVDTLMGKDGMVKRALGNLRQAWFGEFAGRIIAVRYDSLAHNPSEVIGALYRALGQASFPHDFENVSYDEPEYDANLGLPGFHRISGPVRPIERKSILPPEIFRQYDETFWDAPDHNPKKVTLL